MLGGKISQHHIGTSVSCRPAAALVQPLAGVCCAGVTALPFLLPAWCFAVLTATEALLVGLGLEQAVLIASLVCLTRLSFMLLMIWMGGGWVPLRWRTFGAGQGKVRVQWR